ncbi:heavy metal sensor histidine kinase, partial [Ralstonia pseudosolanacearum]
MRRRLSLTARLTALFSLCSAAVLLGLGVVIALAMEQHFAVEDFTALGEHVSVIGKIVESGPAPQAEARIRDALQHRTGFVARILGPDRRALYASDGFDFRAADEALARA